MTDNFLIPDETCFCIFLYLAHRQGPGEKNQNLLGNSSFRLFSIMLSKGCYSRDGFWQECDHRVLTHIPSIRISSSVPEGPSQWAQGYTAGSQLSDTTLQRWLSVEQSKREGTKNYRYCQVFILKSGAEKMSTVSKKLPAPTQIIYCHF